MYIFSYKRCTLANIVIEQPETLMWNADGVAALMFQHNIPSRAKLAEILDIPRSTVNSTFDECWAGRASTRMIARLAAHFRVSITRLVVEPAATIARVKNGQPVPKPVHTHR